MNKPLDCDKIEQEMRAAIGKRASEATPSRLLKRPSATLATTHSDGRPKIPELRVPLLYLGGRIYDDGKRLRCYKQIGDRVEKSIAYKPPGRAEAFAKALESIESDPRVKKARTSKSR